MSTRLHLFELRLLLHLTRKPIYCYEAEPVALSHSQTDGECDNGLVALKSSIDYPPICIQKARDF